MVSALPKDHIAPGGQQKLLGGYIVTTESANDMATYSATASLQGYV